MNQMKIFKSNRQIFFLISLFSIVATISCKEKESIDLCGEDNIGSYNFLVSSKNSIPYSENINLFFLDSVGNQVIFETGNSKYGSMNYIISSVCELDNTKEKIIKAVGDEYFYQIEEPINSLNLKINLSLFVNPFAGESMVTDELLITICENSSTTISTELLHILVNPRELSEDFLKYYSNAVPQVQLLNKIFYNVYSNNDLNCFYNYEFGLIAFKDNDGILWVLDKIEPIVK